MVFRKTDTINNQKPLSILPKEKPSIPETIQRNTKLKSIFYIDDTGLKAVIQIWSQLKELKELLLLHKIETFQSKLFNKLLVIVFIL